MRMWKWAFLLAFLAACDNSYADRVAALESFVREAAMGSSADYWLEKNNAFGEWERVALVFGYINDSQGCADFAAAHKAMFPADDYRCSPANAAP